VLVTAGGATGYDLHVFYPIGFDRKGFATDWTDTFDMAIGVLATASIGTPPGASLVASNEARRAFKGFAATSAFDCYGCRGSRLNAVRRAIFLVGAMCFERLMALRTSTLARVTQPLVGEDGGTTMAIEAPSRGWSAAFLTYFLAAICEVFVMFLAMATCTDRDAIGDIKAQLGKICERFDVVSVKVSPLISALLTSIVVAFVDFFAPLT